MNQESKNHYHLVVGEIVFTDEQTGQVNAVRQNSVVIDPERELPTRLLGKAQQLLQLNFHAKMGDEKIKVVDVVLMNFVHLGYMTNEEFVKTPEGVAVRERPQPVKEATALYSVPAGATASLEELLEPKE